MQLLNFNPNNPTELLATLNLIYPTLNADSAHLAILHTFQHLAITDGGDDELANYDINIYCIHAAQFITPADIELYDNACDEIYDLLPIYQRIKETILKSLPLS